MRISLICILFFISSLTSLSQDNEIKPIVIGLKIGNPNIIGLSGEYIFSKNKKIGTEIELSVLPNFSKQEDIAVSIFAGGINLNYYIFKPAKGLYANFGYFYRTFNHNEKNLIYHTWTNGTSKYSYSISTIKLTSGYKYLYRSIIIKPEIGIGRNFRDEKMDVTEKYPDGFERTYGLDLSEIYKLELIATLTLGLTF